jgi:hypothetical protein
MFAITAVIINPAQVAPKGNLQMHRIQNLFFMKNKTFSSLLFFTRKLNKEKNRIRSRHRKNTDHRDTYQHWRSESPGKNLIQSLNSFNITENASFVHQVTIKKK